MDNLNRSQITSDRYTLIAAMNYIIQSLNDECAYLKWIEVVPDQADADADADDFLDIAEDDELYSDTAKLFRRLLRAYGDCGFYVANDTVV